MPASIAERHTRSPKAQKRTMRKETLPASTANSGFPSRAALTARLEAQRAELLRVMECVNRAHQTLEALVKHSATSEQQHRFYEQSALELLNDAKQSLGAAYPMLERIAEALHADKILEEHTP
jgi:hypothetical protein